MARPRAALVALVCALLLAACGGASPHRSATATTSSLGGNLITLQFKSPSGAEADLHVRVEATEADRERGLMGVNPLPQDEGDLFAWPDVAPNQNVLVPFWMQDTPLNLSIAFISADGRVLEVQDMKAETTTYHYASQQFRFAVEASQGWYAAHNLGAGSTVNLPAALAPLHLPTGTPLAIPPPPAPPPPPPPPPSFPSASAAP